MNVYKVGKINLVLDVFDADVDVCLTSVNAIKNMMSTRFVFPVFAESLSDREGITIRLINALACI